MKKGKSWKRIFWSAVMSAPVALVGAAHGGDTVNKELYPDAPSLVNSEKSQVGFTAPEGCADNKEPYRLADPVSSAGEWLFRHVAGTGDSRWRRIDKIRALCPGRSLIGAYDFLE
jgi:hypothetical protein